jgi:hypothetical protein
MTALEVTQTDKKTIVAIAILSERRDLGRQITYQELGSRVGQVHWGLDQLLY